MKNLLLLFSVLLLFSLLPTPLPAAEGATDSAATTADDDLFSADPFATEEVELQIYDPIEPVNRGIFWVNDKLYFYLFKPVARGLRIVPEPARVSLRNFISNLTTPIRLINCLLQLKGRDAATEITRFVVNSTVGIAGLFDPASSNGLAKKEEDLGQTFGHYGLGSGPYLVLPILGPSNLRDGVGRIGDLFLDPLTYILTDAETLGLKVVDAENELSLDKDTYEGIVKHEIAPYLFIRDAYEQNRAAKVNK